MSGRKKRVLIVEDSAVAREHLRRTIAADERLEVAAAVESAEEALQILDQVAPDVISLDICLPGMQGFEATRRIMAHRPTPIVIVSASVASDQVNLTMEALKSGALAAVEKPGAANNPNYRETASKLCTQLAIMSEVKVVRQRKRPADAPRVQAPPPWNRCDNFRVLGIAASTGGPNALLAILRELGREFPLPMAIVQHMTPAFVAGFGEWLSKACSMDVELVTANTVLVPGRAYLSPSGRHLLVDRVVASTRCGVPGELHCPSADALFRSMASNLGSEALAVLLTGMGEDGAEGLLEVRRAGGYTIAENESTAVVYGMPGAAVRMGAVRESLPVSAVARRLWELVEKREEVA